MKQFARLTIPLPAETSPRTSSSPRNPMELAAQEEFEILLAEASRALQTMATLQDTHHAAGKNSQ
jgi:hypothetical protein